MKRVLILGYYDKLNFGDDIFKYVFKKYIFNKNEFELHIYNLDTLDDIIKQHENDPYEYIIIGGGDLINDYYFNSENIQKFRDNFANIPILFYGIGLSYLSMLPALDIGDYFFMRNKNDYYSVSARFSNNYTFYTPDLAYFLLNESSLKTYKNQKVITPAQQLKIGVCLPYTWFVNNNDESNVFFMEMSELIGELSKKHLIYIVPFDTSNNPKNSDLILLQKLQSILRLYEFNSNSEQRIFYINSTNDITSMINIFKGFDCVLASRYHSVIMSILTDTPFISLYTTRKVENIKSEVNSNLYNFFIPLDKDVNGIPIKLNKEQFYKSFDEILNNYINIRNELCNTKKYLYSILVNTYAKFSSLFLQNNIKRSGPPQYVSEERVNHLVNKTVKNVLKLFKLDNQKNIKSIHSGKSLVKLISPRGRVPSGVQKKVTEEILWSLTGDPYAPYYYGLFENAHKGALVPQLKWIIDDYHEKYKYARNKTDTIKLVNKNFQELHRSGWQFIVNNLIVELNKRDDINKPFIIDTYVDKTFHWNKKFYESKGIIPYRKEWIGFIHHTYSDYVNQYNCEQLFTEDLFIQSLENCKCIIVMSEYLKKQIETSLDILYNRNDNPLINKVNVHVVYHPTEITKDLFTYEKFLNNKDKQIIQIGNWLRNVFSIYQLDLPTNSVIQHKSVLKNKNSNNYFLPDDFFDNLFNNLNINKPNNIVDMCKITFDNLHLKGMYEYIIEMENSVKVIEYLDNDKYDKLLCENIVFVKFVDASATNTVIECILRNTPILVNPIEPVVELLGDDYPFYYNTIYEASKLLEDCDKIKETYEYLLNMDKSRFYIDTFINNIRELILTFM